jgi:uncharacterized protein (TIGR00369 family)
MSVTTEASQGLLERTQNQAHPLCAICGQANGSGLRLRFVLEEDDTVEAEFDCDDRLQGYEGVLHGGMTSCLLDGAMTNCLFARGLMAVTGKLEIRFRHPICTGRPLKVRAWVERSSPPLHVAKAEIVQDGQPMASAVGRFMEKLGNERARETRASVDQTGNTGEKP